MDPTTINILIGATSPIALLVVGYWLKRMADDRTRSIIAATESAKVVAEGAAALARENLEKSKTIEAKVDGRLTKAVDDLAASRLEVKDLHTAFSVFQVKVDAFLQTGVGRGALKEAAAEGMPAVAEPITGNPSEKKP